MLTGVLCGLRRLARALTRISRLLFYLLNAFLRQLGSVQTYPMHCAPHTQHLPSVSFIRQIPQPFGLPTQRQPTQHTASGLVPQQERICAPLVIVARSLTAHA